jgi:hypothetical protein
MPKLLEVGAEGTNIRASERNNWLIYDDDWGGIDYNRLDTETNYIWYYGFSLFDNSIQFYLDKPEMLRFLKVFTDKKNQRIMRKEMSKLEEDLTEVINPTDEKENSV